MKNNNMTFTYNAETGVSVCEIMYNNTIFKGEAHCHEEDFDFMSERVGMTIAEARANIGILKFMRDNEIKPQLKILKRLYSNVKTSKNNNPKSHETKMMRRLIRELEIELHTISNAIVDERKFVKDYIDSKEKLYQRLRAKI